MEEGRSKRVGRWGDGWRVSVLVEGADGERAGGREVAAWSSGRNQRMSGEGWKKIWVKWSSRGIKN